MTAAQKNLPVFSVRETLKQNSDTALEAEIRAAYRRFVAGPTREGRAMVRKLLLKRRAH